MIKLLENYEVKELFKILSDPDIIKNLVDDPTQVTVNTLPALLLRTLPGTTSIAYAIYSDEELVGAITLNNISLIRRSAYLGIAAVKKGAKAWCGFNATKDVIGHCFNTLGLNRVYSHTWSDNQRM